MISVQVDDPNLNDFCRWEIQDLGRGPFLYQSSNAYSTANIETVGCNAIYRAKDYTDFIMQIEVDNYDNDGVGFVFGYKDALDHFKIHKRLDPWPSPTADNVDGPHYKVMKRIGQFPCVGGMNATNACYQAVAWTDVYGVFHQGAPMDAVQPWQYADRYYDYEIGRGQQCRNQA